MQQLFTTKKLRQRLALLFFLLFSCLLTQAQVITPDTICSGASDVVYGVSSPTAGSSFSWSLSSALAGTIDNSISTNDSIIQIDWGATAGTYTLYVVETGMNGCMGDTVSLDIVIQAPPTIIVAIDSVCSDASATMTWVLTGEAPWLVDYTDGITTFSESVSSSPHTVSLAVYSSNANISITSVTDGSTAGCAVTTGLPSTVLYVYPKPSTGGIFHY